MAKREWLRAGMALVLVLPAIAWSGAREDVDAAIARFAQAQSFHASISTAGSPASETDFIAPDRYRMTLPDGRVQVVVDGTMYMRDGDAVQRVQVPPEVLARWRQRTGLSGLGAGMQATALGEDVLDGASARKYAITRPGEAAPAMTIWIGTTGYPLQVEANGMAEGKPVTTTIRYSRFNDPNLAITAPE